ncbi:mitochondrial 2-oxoglutarate/malate carrier protein-like isoform X1 [Nasonia vitripennis]|uniref:Mitochondrial 2-oxoglutarate/malate carrier protein n=1 Tax=Nasonia vitripennis TaxID=7425 RepID=A0A7M7G6N0_NASVI|nr:mitochondrial 2-oxoglutarate/malate carrier protein-like isoform X1 [Nasonia vitripennis]
MSGNKDSGSGPPKKVKPLPPLVNFLNAGLSGMCATCFVHPMDVLKNRMQMSKEGVTITQTISTIFRNEGIFKFYAGLSAGLVRQATYTTARLGIYNQLQDIYRERYSEEKPTFARLALMAATAGSMGAFVGTPAEVALVRMTSDGRLPPEQRRNYKSVVDAFARIVREEGVSTLWRGSVATMGRAAIVNVSQLATYSQAKIIIASELDVPEGVQLHFYASMLSGVITAFNSMPFDITKTRIQNRKSTDGKLPGMFGVMFDIARTEGFRALWKGFWPTYCRIGPHTVITFMFNEQFARLYRLYFMQ